jgi:hypothetical protein
MSRKPRKKTVQLIDVSGRKPRPTGDSDWEQLAANPTLREAFRDLSTRLQQAQAEAAQRAVRLSSEASASDFLDFRQALAVIDQHPELLPYLKELQHSDRREQLRAETVIKQSPTGSYPQSQQWGMGGWSGSGGHAQGIPNAALWRYYADTDEWLRGGINIRRDQVGRADITVVPGDPRRKYNKSIQYALELLLDQPNELRQNWSEQASGVTEDILTLGRGAWSKSMTVDRKPMAIYAEDVATIHVYPGWNGDPDSPRYLYKEPGGSRSVPLRNDEIIMPFLNPATYRFSLSPVQVLVNTIKADIEGTRQALRMMEQKPPPHAFQIPSASQAQLEALRDAYERDIMGSKELFWFGGPNQAVHFPLIFSAKENQFLEYQVYLVRKICAILQISPQQLGVTFDINKATAGVQQEIYEDTGLIPLLLLLEEYLNRELVGDYAPVLPYGRYDLYALNLRAIFPMISEQARQLHAQQSLQMAATGLAGLPAMTLNQVLAARGEEPVKGGDTFYVMTASGPMPWLSYDGELGDYTPISTGGALGSQDPAGGPDQDTEEPVATDDEDGESVAADDTPSSPDSDTSTPADTGDTGETTDSKALWYDTRPPGKRWKPSHMCSVTPNVTQKGATDLVPPEERAARQTLQREVTRIFEGATRRGKEGRG